MRRGYQLPTCSTLHCSMTCIGLGIRQITRVRLWVSYRAA